MTQWVEQGPWTIPHTAVHEVEHEHRTWRVTVAQAQPAPAGGVLSRVVYVLDPFGTLMSAVQIARTTQVLGAGALPALLVVGIGPAADDVGELAQRRMLDLTPTQPDAASLEQTAGAGLTFGGADAFLDLLLEVVAPEVEQRYTGDAADRTLAGWSLGGLTAAHALATRPGAFRRYLMVSPSLWWGDAAVLHATDGVRAQTGAVDVYVTAGDLEQTSWDRVWPPLPEELDRSTLRDARMVSNVRKYAGALRDLRMPELTVHDEVLRGEHHNTLWAAAFTRGLLALHATGYSVDG